MVAFLVSFAFIQYWLAIGLAIAGLLPERLRRHNADFLAAPALGMCAILIPVFWLNRLGAQVGAFSAWLFAASLAMSLVSLAFRLRREGIRAFAARYARTMPFLILAGLTVGWPIFVHGFDWLGTLNSDMTNDVLAAQRFAETGYFSLPSTTTEFNGSDIPSMYWLVHATLVRARAGNQLSLALWIGITGLTGFQLIGAFLVALQTVLAGATAAFAATKFTRRASLYGVFLLCTVDPLFGTGVVLQLSAQTGGVAILLVGLWLMHDVWKTASNREVMQLSTIMTIVFAAQFIWYPEVVPILGGGTALYLAVNWRKWLWNQYFFKIVGFGIAILALFLNTYLIDAIATTISDQIPHGAGSSELNLVFFQFLKPDGISKFWGLQALHELPSDITPLAIGVGIILSIGLLIIAIRQLRRLELIGCALTVMCALGVLLAHNRAGFGLLKWAMFIQPFVIAAIIAEIDFMTGNEKPRAVLLQWRWAASAPLALLWILVQGHTQYQQGLSSLDTVADSTSSLRGASAAKLTSVLLATKEAAGKPDLYILDMPLPAGARMASVYTRGVPLDPVSLCLPLASAINDLCAMLDPKRARDETQFKMINKYTAAIRHTPFEWSSGLNDELQQAPQQQQVLTANDVLLPLAWRYSPLNHSYPLTKDEDKGVSLSQLKNYLILVITPKSQFDPFNSGANFILPGIGRMETDFFVRGEGMFATVRYLLLRALNPTPRARLEIQYSRSLTRDRDNRLPPATFGNTPNRALGFVGRGSAHIFTPPAPVVLLHGDSYVMIDLGMDPRPFPYEAHGVMALFGASYNVDWRRVVGWTRNISLVSEDVVAALKAPQSISKFPDDLANPDLEYSGLYEDGWTGEEAFVRLAGNHETAQLVIKGEYPAGIPGVPGTDKIEVLADGVKIGEQVVTSGVFTIVADLPPTMSNTVKVDLRGSTSYNLPGADGRIVSFRLLSLGWQLGKSAATSPPAASAAPPATLSSDPFEAEGIYPDGWINGRATIHFHLGTSKKTTLTIAGFLPGAPPHGALTEVLRVLNSDLKLTETVVRAGNFGMTIPLPSPVHGDVDLVLEGDASYPLTPPDTRSASFRILHVQWGSEEAETKL